MSGITVEKEVDNYVYEQEWVSVWCSGWKIPHIEIVHQKKNLSFSFICEKRKRNCFGV